MELKELHDAFKERSSEFIKKLAAIETQVTTNTDEANARLLEIEQKMVRDGGEGFAGGSGHSLGEQFINSPGFKRPFRRCPNRTARATGRT